MKGITRRLARLDGWLAGAEAAALCLLLLALMAGILARVVQQNAGVEAAARLRAWMIWPSAALVLGGGIAILRRLPRAGTRGAAFEWGSKAILIGGRGALVCGGLLLGDAADHLLRGSVLWIGLIGASLATRQRKHITIEALGRVLPPPARRATLVAVGLAALTILAVLLRVSVEYVAESRERAEVYFTFRETGFEFREWWVRLILPVALAIMVWRTLLLLMQVVGRGELGPIEGGFGGEGSGGEGGAA